MRIRMTPGSLIVFEGLDGTGKSTQLENVKLGIDNGMFDPAVPVLTTHQPSGGTDLGAAIYRITEDNTIASPLARQFLHLASHAEHYKVEIAPHLLRGGAVFMDRCWISTLAYGWFGGKLHEDIATSSATFLEVATWPTLGWMPDLVFMFEHVHRPDANNNQNVVAGYDWIKQHIAESCVVIPSGSTEEVIRFIFMTLSDRGLAEPIAGA